MRVQVISESGYEEAALGFSLSYNSVPERAFELFPKFAHRNTGENKFLRFMTVYLDVDAPRYWWQQMDQYHFIESQSESTMHTLMKRPLAYTDFEGPIPPGSLDFINTAWALKDFERMKALLPEAFLQRRVLVTNYAQLQTIIAQRRGHKLKEWDYFIRAVLEQARFPNFLEVRDD